LVNIWALIWRYQWIFICIIICNINLLHFYTANNVRTSNLSSRPSWSQPFPLPLHMGFVYPSNIQLVLTFPTRTCNFNAINIQVVLLALHMKAIDT
jgi:hypothetical protein